MINLNEIKRDVSIVEYARIIGLHPVKIGRYYTLKEHDSVRINPDKNIFVRNSTGECGSVVDFAMAFAGLNFKDAINEISKYTGAGVSEISNSADVTVKKEYEKDKAFSLKLPEQDSNMKNVFAYLCKTRGIDQQIVQEMVEKKALYQDIHKNCVFVSREESGKPKFASIRGTNTYKKFVADAFGCDYSYGLRLPSNGKSSLIVTESAIDSMSVMNLIKLNGNDYHDYDFIALSGVGKGETVVKNAVVSKGYSRVYLCLDNDDAGRKASIHLKENIEKATGIIDVKIQLPRMGKDYNDMLIAVKEKTKENTKDFKKCIDREL